MPRPKRTKLKSTYVPVAKVTAASSQASIAPNQSLDQLKSPQGHSSSFGEDSDGLVRKARQSTRRAGKTDSVGDSYSMAGGLGFGDLKNAHHALDEQNIVLQRVRKELQHEDAKGSGGRVSGLLRSGTLKRTADKRETSGLRTARISPVEGEDGEAILQSSETPRDSVETSEKQPLAIASQDSQGQLVRNEETQIVEKVVDSFPPTQVDATNLNVKALATPSITGISNFKRRPRQPSILRMVQQRLENDDDDDEDENLDLRLDGESTLLGQHMSSSPPVHQKSSLAAPRSPEVNTSSSRKRKLQEFVRGECSPLSSPPQSTPSQSKRSRLSSKAKSFLTGTPPVENESPSASASSGSELPRPTERTRMSSSPSAPLPRHLTRQSQRTSTSVARQAQQKPAATVEATSPLSTPPSSSVVSSPTKQRPTKPPPKPKALLTASLQAFLPRRRHFELAPTGRTPRKDAGTFDILSSSSETPSAEEEEEEEEEDDDDDDGDVDAHGRPSRLRKNVKKLTAAAKKRSLVKKTRAASAGPKTPGKASGKPTGAASKKTYGRRAIDKENPGRPRRRNDDNASSDDEEDDVDDGGRVASATKGKRTTSREMAEAAKKFAEVDEWELEFESQDIGGGGGGGAGGGLRGVGEDARGSSPWR